MKLIVFGATGRTGKYLVQQSLAQGHFVTAFVRDPSRFAVQHERCQIVHGDVLDPGSVEKAMEGQDVVLCALGLRKRESTAVLTDGTQHISFKR